MYLGAEIGRYRTAFVCTPIFSYTTVLATVATPFDWWMMMTSGQACDLSTLRTQVRPARRRQSNFRFLWFKAPSGRLRLSETGISAYELHDPDTLHRFWQGLAKTFLQDTLVIIKRLGGEEAVRALDFRAMRLHRPKSRVAA